jgi:hypothetical protein
MGLLVAVIGITGCQTSKEKSTSKQAKRDSQIAKDVKKNLESDPTFKYSDVKANVYDGNVELSGFVEVPDQRLRAAELAARTSGARQIINQIMLKPMATGPATIRDPLGQETSRILVDTNSPPPQMRNLLPSENTPQQPVQSQEVKPTQ